MERKRKKWGFVVVGAVAVLTLGVIAVASAAGSQSEQSASPSPSASAQAGQAHAPDFDGDGPHGDGDGVPYPRWRPRRHPRGSRQAERQGREHHHDAARRRQELRQIAKAYGVGTDELLAEATKIETAELDAAVKAGAITEAQRTQELSGLQARLQAALTETARAAG